MLRFYFTLIAIHLSAYSFSMVRVEQTQINGLDVSPSALCNVSLFNDGEGAEISLCIQIKDLSGNRLMEFYTLAFFIPSGFHSSSELRPIPLNPVYGNSSASQFMMTNQMLPEGKYLYCCLVIQKKTTEWSDEYSEEFSSGMDSFLQLVSPADADSIAEQRPVFNWLHSSDFSMLQDDEYFKLICTEMIGDKSPSEAIENDPPVFVKDRLNTHLLNFPFELPPLEKGKSYAWEVQKISSNHIVSKTETWKFSIIDEKPPEYDKYVSLSRTLNANFYTVREGKIFFRFDENYLSGKMECKLYNEKRELLKGLPENEKGEHDYERRLKSSGYNRFEMDLNPFSLKNGYYLLEVRNEKNENFKLKFYVP